MSGPDLCAGGLVCLLIAGVGLLAYYLMTDDDDPEGWLT